MYVHMSCTPCTTAIPLYVWYPEPKMTLPGMHIWHVHPSMLILFGVTTESIPNIGDDMGLQHVISRGHKWLLLIWGDTHIISERCGNYDPVLVMLWWSPSCLTLMTNHVATLIWGYTNILSGCHKIGNDMGYITWYQSHLIWSLWYRGWITWVKHHILFTPHTSDLISVRAPYCHPISVLIWEKWGLYGVDSFGVLPVKTILALYDHFGPSICIICM